MKKKLAIVLIIALAVTAVLLITCGAGSRELRKAKTKAITEIEQVDENDYMEEDRPKVNELINETKHKIHKAKDKEGVEKVLSTFRQDLEKIPTRKSLIDMYKNKIIGFVMEKDEVAAEKTKELVNSFDDLLYSADSRKQLMEDVKTIASQVQEKLNIKLDKEAFSKESLERYAKTIKNKVDNVVLNIKDKVQSDSQSNTSDDGQ